VQGGVGWLGGVVWVGLQPCVALGPGFGLWLCTCLVQAVDDRAAQVACLPSSLEEERGIAGAIVDYLTRQGRFREADQVAVVSCLPFVLHQWMGAGVGAGVGMLVEVVVE
jgi:hypothetical protein